MNLWLSKMNHALFNVFPERLNANWLPPGFKLDQTDGDFCLECLLFIRGDAINLSRLLVCDTLRISQGPGRGFCLSIRFMESKMQSLVGGHVSHPISLVCGGRFLLGKVLGQFASGTGCLGPNIL